MLMFDKATQRHRGDYYYYYCANLATVNWQMWKVIPEARAAAALVTM